ncbi:bacillithiol biosynthesis deacetylase BshB2 [Bacillus hominis]|uniref:Bacillithiol biosynthesis deacetylase BshB2 n=1 Tax=Bacillus hominis TaxID=2817478 RepID=A0ABT7R9K6_9BACI|nr:MULTISPECIES: bacillithiol biosynthesis deacetylase BshB2 [Bacillus]MBK5433853.1 bacillithiol biosynthesis deacetylase BshB2 [Bacillus sp. TH25]MDM5194488.1 bacillithiol biosynthesis deacetylase BshB2 [Bacillus hominis]MDM5434191.1 bacillithiol biosynthesis deacetylase BshB2 [Bacillus hominis]MDM5439613.1 bacillithiol biosynthesis deacetylase BshB2 [Bacillus hominis]QWH29605.1 bacillithiol biosynthesis deacetylase BshB2 [Bacillus mycoides]
MERHVLVVFPHPDDEAFAAGGTIRLLTDQGVPVTYACGTLGQMGRNMGKNVFANRETIPNIREKELKDACEAMGIQDLRMLGFHDKTLEFEDVDFVADKIETIIQEVNPSRIITFYPEHGVHPDHDAFGRAVVRAVSRMSKEERPVIHAVAITKNREAVLGEADVVNNISEVFEHKLAALGAHRSQTEAMLEETHAKIKNKDAATLKWLQLEQFWTYKWE